MPTFPMLTDQPKEVDRFLKFNLVYILTTICADGIGLILGSVLNPVVRIKKSLACYSVIHKIEISYFLIAEWNICRSYVVIVHARL